MVLEYMIQISGRLSVDGTDWLWAAMSAPESYYISLLVSYVAAASAVFTNLFGGRFDNFFEFKFYER